MGRTTTRSQKMDVDEEVSVKSKPTPKKPVKVPRRTPGSLKQAEPSVTPLKPKRKHQTATLSRTPVLVTREAAISRLTPRPDRYNISKDGSITLKLTPKQERCRPKIGGTVIANPKFHEISDKKVRREIKKLQRKADKKAGVIRGEAENARSAMEAEGKGTSIGFGAGPNDW
jgi:hypothetical protein